MISGSRAVISLLILGQYISFFLRKQTSFIMLMCFAFLLLAVGYTAILTKYVLSNQDAISNEGDLVRIFGFAILFIAYIM